MTDKELIKQEIERLKHTSNAYDRSRFMLLLEIEKFIDSLPEEPTDEANCTRKSDDLEEEIDNYIKDNFFGSGSMGFFSNRTKQELNSIDVANIAHHFAEWQKQQMNETLQTEYEKDRYDMQQEMMKDAVELHIVESFNPVGTENEKPHGFIALCYNAKYPDFYPVTGQTIKVVPIKEIQKKMSKIAEKKALEAFPMVISEQTVSCRLSYSEGYDQAMQDFLEKAEDFLYLQLNNGLIECKNIKRLIEQFKNYMQHESKN